MLHFRGIFQHAIDEKGRVSVPNRFRDVLKSRNDDRLVVTLGTSRCLAVYPLERWEQTEEDLDTLPAGPEKDEFVRHFIAPAQDCAPDKMGRILIPASLREEVGLDKNVVVLGAVSKFEIWDSKTYEEYLTASRPSALALLKTHNIRF